ncbi:SMC-Scp complex subunit ScpB [Pelagibacteraceae bacterium]|nr:SMC-Scp complex subunit ScpB [Pelagibacteraceae bacterium]
MVEKDIKLLEAILFASGEPVSETDLKEKIKSRDKIKQYLSDIKKFYEKRGINLIKTGNKWSFRTSEDLIDDLTIFKTQKRKLSRAALETLSIIAYQQPITRSEIENIRGVQMGRGSIDHLMEIGWIKPSGRRNIPGKPTLWSTTELFIEHFGLNDLLDLPNKDELKASGFLDKRAAIATISDLAQNDEVVSNQDSEDINDEENLEDFIQNPN